MLHRALLALLAGLVLGGCLGSETKEPPAGSTESQKCLADPTRAECQPTRKCDGSPSCGDVPQMPGLMVDPAHVEDSLCHNFCHWASHCGDDDEFGGADCHMNCMQMIASGYANNVACYAAACRQKAACITPEPIQVPPACKTLCAHADTCWQVMAFDLPPEQKSCEMVCAGEAVAFPAFGQALSCIGDRMGVCDLEGAMSCMKTGALYCPHLCEEVGSCWKAYPDKASCYSDCEARSPAESYAMRRCFDKLQCDATKDCTDGAVVPVCEQLADLILHRCNGRNWPALRDFLVEECSKFGRQFGMPARDDVLGCLNDSTCFDPQQVLCAWKPPEECTTYCKKVVECDATQQQTGCEIQCMTQFGLNKPMLADAATCAKSATCDTIAGCRPAQFADGFCKRYCDEAKKCGLPQGSDGCEQRCQNQLVSGQANSVAQLSCAAAGTCADATGCYQRPPLAIDDACIEACRMGGSACHHIAVAYDQGMAACTEVCSDQLLRHNRQGDEAGAMCVVHHLSHDCIPTSDFNCF